MENVNLLSNNQNNIFFFPRGLPFHSFIFCFVVYGFILHSCCHALGFWICMMNECKLNFVGVATWLFATPVCDSVLRPDHPNLSSQFGHFAYNVVKITFPNLRRKKIALSNTTPVPVVALSKISARTTPLKQENNRNSFGR